MIDRALYPEARVAARQILAHTAAGDLATRRGPGPGGSDAGGVISSSARSASVLDRPRLLINARAGLSSMVTIALKRT